MRTEIDNVFKVAGEKYYPVILDLEFLGKHTSRLMRAINLLSELVNITCLNPPPENLSSEGYISLLTNKASELSVMMYSNLLELISAISRTSGVTSASYMSSVSSILDQIGGEPAEEDSPMDMIQKLVNHQIVFVQGLGNYKAGSKTYELGDITLGSVLSPTLLEAIESTTFAYLYELCVLVNYNHTAPNSKEKEIFINKTALNILSYYFIILDLMGENIKYKLYNNLISI